MWWYNVFQLWMQTYESKSPDILLEYMYKVINQNMQHLSDTMLMADDTKGNSFSVQCLSERNSTEVECLAVPNNIGTTNKNTNNANRGGGMNNHGSGNTSVLSPFGLMHLALKPII